VSARIGVAGAREIWRGVSAQGQGRKRIVVGGFLRESHSGAGPLGPFGQAMSCFFTESDPARPSQRLKRHKPLPMHRGKRSQ
jgi:hypothetical protein